MLQFPVTVPSLFCYNNVLYHIPFLSYVVPLRCLRWIFIPSLYKHTFIILLFFLKWNCLYSLGEFFFSWKKIFHQLYLFPNCIFLRCPERKYYFTIFGISRSFLLSCMFFRVLGKYFLIRMSTIFYHFLYFPESTFVSVHYYYFSEFVLITYLQYYIFIIFHLSQVSEKNYITSP